MRFWVAASAPEVPETLLSQLTVGGRLIIPVGRHRFRQTLRRVTRRGELEYEQDDLGGVAFVPLIGSMVGRRTGAPDTYPFSL